MSDTSWASWAKAQGVVAAGDGKYPICMSSTSSDSTPVAFVAGDFIGELNDINGMGASRSTREINGYRYDSAVKQNGSSTPNDVTLTLNMVRSDVTLLRGYYKNQTKVAIGIFDNDVSHSLLYGCVGTIQSWNMSTPLGDTATVSVTVSIINDEVAHTFTAS